MENFIQKDETGIKFESITQVDENWYHLTFDARSLDPDGDFYETAQIVVQVQGDDLGKKSMNEITEIGRKRVAALLNKFNELC